MIATVKVLGLQARDFASLAAAAWRVVEYVQGGSGQHQPARTGAARYYSSDAQAGGASPDQGSAAPESRVAAGLARGSAAGLVGLEGSVTGEQLHRLLMGQHASTGRWLVPGRGSTGRTLAASRPIPSTEKATGQGAGEAPGLAAMLDQLTLAQAAQVAGVTPSYLRRLAEDHELERNTRIGKTGGPAQSTDPPPESPTRREPVGEYLAATRDPDRRRWLVTQQELGRFMRERQPPTVVIGYDLVCSAPKSVSLLWAFGDHQLRDDITAALNAGVNATLAYLEEYGVVGTVTGRNRPGLGLAAASY